MQGAQTASRFRGIGRYSMALVQHLIEIAKEHEVLLLLNAALSEPADELIVHFMRYLPRERIRVFEPIAPTAWSSAPNHWRAMIMEPVREAVIAECAPDVVLITSLFEGYHDDAVTSIGAYPLSAPTAVIHYDLIPHSRPEYLRREEQRAFYSRKFEQLKRADLLLAISEASREEAIDALDLASESIVNISAAVSAEFLDDSHDAVIARQALSRLGVNKRYVLYAPGGFDSRKNFGRLIEAFAALPEAIRRDYQLVIPGKLDHGRSDLLLATAAEAGLDSGALLLLGYVSEDDLRVLYRSAALFVFPSLHEGFGLPVLEAIASGAPVIASNTSSLPEVVGNEAALFDPLDVKSISELMLRVLSDAEFRQSLVDSGLRQVEQFSWAKTAATALAALEQLAAGAQIKQAALSIEQQLPECIKSSLKQSLTAEQAEALAACLASNLQLGQAPQFLIDVTELRMADSKTGIQRVVRSLLLSFLSSPPAGFRVCPIYYDGHHFRHATAFAHGLVGSAAALSADDLVDFYAGDVYLGLDFNLTSTPRAEDYLRRLSRRGVRLCFVIYDMLPLLKPHWWPPEMRTRFEIWIRTLSALADTVCCISAAVADEFSAWFDETRIRVQCATPKVRYFHLGADLNSSAPTVGWPPGYGEVRQRLETGITFLMVGTVEPRKGHAQVLAGFDELWAAGADVNLVIVGKPGWMVTKVIAALESHPQLGERLFWFNAASDQCLEDLYARADCLLAASEGEGFGLPLIEAAQHGVPIIARELPVFKEVAGDGAYYFDGSAPEDIAQAVARWMPLYKSGIAPSPLAIDWLTWEQSAAQLLSAMGMVGARLQSTAPEDSKC